VIENGGRRKNGNPIPERLPLFCTFSYDILSYPAYPLTGRAAEDIL